MRRGRRGRRVEAEKRQVAPAKETHGPCGSGQNMNIKQQSTASNTKPVPTARTIRTLLVDDSPIMLTAMARILEKEGRTLLIGAVTDGWLALRTALQSTPDLVLMDLHLPHLNGAEATRYLKLLPNPPIVFMVTSDDSPDAQAVSKASGADAFVVKAADLDTQLRLQLQEWFGLAAEAT